MFTLLRRCAVVLLVSLQGAILAGCASVIGGPLEGVVFDVASGEPIPGAFAVAVTHLQGSDGVGSRSFCADLDVVQVDGQGRYRLSRGSLIAAADREVRAYAPGYERSTIDDSRGVGMKRFTGSDDRRAEAFIGWSSLVGCGRIGEVAPKLRPLYAAVDAEDRALKPGRRLGRAGYLSEMLRDMEAR